MSAVHVSTRPSVLDVLRDYYQLTKPTIVMLMLVTGLPAILMAGKGFPAPWLMVVALLGTAMAAGAASALNHWYDRDIDGLMERTNRRPIISGSVGPNQALAFGLIMSALSVLLLGFFANWLSAFLAFVAIFYYVVIYTMWLKRRTPQNIVIGGGAGSMAPLIGWAAITGNVGLPAWLMFLIVFMWTPPHFWALALYRRTDYAKAGVPMMPVVAGEDSTRLQIVVYTVLLVATTLALHFTKATGLIYLVGALGLGASFTVGAFKLYREKTDAAAKKLFMQSIFYLLILFVLLFVDEVARIALPILR
ncbi:heme o synthase [bacterium]|nr:heme o synthase [bacterium]